MRRPDDLNLGAVQARLQVGDAAGARAQLTRIVASQPPLGAAWGDATRLARALQDIDLAILAAERWIVDEPADAQRQAILFELVSETGAGERALAIARALVATAPHSADRQYMLGLALARAGKLEEAETAFRRSIAAQPDHLAAWEQLSIVKTFQPDDRDIDALRTLEHRIPEGHPERASLLYALGKAYDDVGDVDKAFAAFAQGAGNVFARHPFDVAPMAAHLARLRGNFSAPLLDHFAGSGQPTDRPVFVVGMPRSGTTLIERIVAAHGDVRAGGEMRLLPLAAAPLRNLEGIDIQRFLDTAAARGVSDPWAALGRDYLERLTARFGSNVLVTDKNLATHLYVGAIRLMLPEARLIYCRRDPADICWSTYRSHFFGGQWWTYDLPTIARYQHVYQQLMDHWCAVVPADRLLVVDYEALVSAPQVEIARLLAFLGLEAEPACFDFHTKPATVLTRSLAQVRQPVHTRSIGGWRRYEKHLAPYLETYARAERALRN